MTDKKYLQPNEVKEIIESSFAPYRCKAKLLDWNDDIKFKVLDEEDNIIIEIHIFHINSIDKKDLA